MSYPPPPPHGPYPPQSGPPYQSGWPPYQPPQVDQEKAGLFKAGKVALWVWIVITVVPILFIVGCCVACWGAGLLGSVMPAPSQTP